MIVSFELAESYAEQIEEAGVEGEESSELKITQNPMRIENIYLTIFELHSSATLSQLYRRVLPNIREGKKKDRLLNSTT